MQTSVPQMISTNKQFLEGIMGEYYPAAHITGFREDPSQLDTLGLRHYWGGTIYQNNPVEDPEANNFFTISTFHPDPEDSKARRRKANFAAAWCMMIDDIGSGPGAKINDIDMLAYPIKPSWRIETSPGNYQWGFIFQEPEFDRLKVEALLKGLVACGMVDGGEDPGMLGCTRYARLPIGSNTKAKYGQPFRHRLEEWSPDRKYTVEQIAAAFAINLESFRNEVSTVPPIAKESDPIYQSLERLGLVKETIREGIYDIVCPWIGEHSDRADSGAAYLSPGGFKCHHGHCQTRTGHDLLNWLHGSDPVYRDVCAAALPFQPVSGDVESGDTKVKSTQLSDVPFEGLIEQALLDINPNDPGSMDAAFQTLAIQWPKLEPAEREHWVHRIKDESTLSLKVIREQIKRTRSNLLKENRQGQGILNEPAWKKFDGDKVLSHFDNFRAVCDFHGIRIRYNKMSHALDVAIPERTFSREDIDNLNLSYMSDLCHEYGLGRGMVGQWMNMLGFENEYHPFAEYLDGLRGTVPYDPLCPNFEKLLSTLHIEGDQETAVVFIQRWMISLVAAARGASNFKGTLVFAGPQSIGKTSWFRNLLPERDMFIEGLTLDARDKDSTINATSHLLCELGELDSTFRREISALKAFLSSETDKIRQPYATKASYYPRRTIFCGTVNEQDFLVDQTGNSRFWPVSVRKCNFVALSGMWGSGEMDQLWHEIDAMYQAYCDGRPEFRWWLDAVELGMLSKASEDYIKHSPGEAMLRRYFDFKDGAPLVQFMGKQEILDTIGLREKDNFYQVRSAEVFSAVKRLTGQTQDARKMVDGVRTRGYMMPRTLASTLEPELPFEPKLSVIQSIDDFI